MKVNRVRVQRAGGQGEQQVRADLASERLRIGHLIDVAQGALTQGLGADVDSGERS